MVVDKPAGLPSTGYTLSDVHCVQYQLQVHLRGARVWAVHQLDKDTSGVNVFALKKSQVAVWSARLRRGRKTYWGIVSGCWTRGQTVIEARIDRVAGQPAVVSSGRPARTRVIPLRVAKTASLLALTLDTGRTHQIRLHLAHVGHPLLGESRYGAAPCRRAPRHILHARTLAVRTESGEKKQFQAPLPEDFVQVLEQEQLSPPKWTEDA